MPTGLSILIVDDEDSTRKLCRDIAVDAALQAHTTGTTEQALELLEQTPVDIVLTDLKVPDVGGIELLKLIRSKYPHIAVMMLTQYGSIETAITATRLGALDYIAKPFSPREVVARVRAVLRRVQGGRGLGSRVLRFGRLEIHEAAREARIDGVDIGLKPREYQLLRALVDNAGIAMSREVLMRKVWGYDFDGGDRTVDVHIRRLRQKLVKEAGLAECLQTLHGYGYKFSPP